MPGAPTIIGDYRVTRVLGRGGMGAVYLADDPLLDRRVAIKVIDGYRDHPSARARFLVEARAIARLNHPNVVAVYRAGEHAGEPYLVSEFVDGTPLDQLPRPLAPDLTSKTTGLPEVEAGREISLTNQSIPAPPIRATTMPIRTSMSRALTRHAVRVDPCSSCRRRSTSTTSGTWLPGAA